MMLIGLSGYARTGKDTVAQFLVERHGFHRVAFADALKQIAEEIDPIVTGTPGRNRLGDLLAWRDDDRNIAGGEPGWEYAKGHNPEVRRFLQKLGEACRVFIDEDIWVETAMRQAAKHRRVVISDVRYPNEADAIRIAGGEIWRIQRADVGPANSHISETALDWFPFDRHLPNRGNLNQLAAETTARLAEMHHAKVAA